MRTTTSSRVVQGDRSHTVPPGAATPAPTPGAACAAAAAAAVLGCRAVVLDAASHDVQLPSERNQPRVCVRVCICVCVAEEGRLGVPRVDGGYGCVDEWEEGGGDASVGRREKRRQALRQGHGQGRLTNGPQRAHQTHLHPHTDTDTQTDTHAHTRCISTATRGPMVSIQQHHEPRGDIRTFWCPASSWRSASGKGISVCWMMARTEPMPEVSTLRKKCATG
jgi:hypothetical protein